MTVFDDEGDILADNGFTAIGAIFKSKKLNQLYLPNYPN